jgi:hypothetical protein
MERQASHTKRTVKLIICVEMIRRGQRLSLRVSVVILFPTSSLAHLTFYLMGVMGLLTENKDEVEMIN